MDLKVVAIVVRQDGAHEQADRMVAEVAGYISDPKFAGAILAASGGAGSRSSALQGLGHAHVFAMDREGSEVVPKIQRKK